MTGSVQFMTARARIALLVVAGAVTLAAALPQFADAADFKMTVRGSQTFNWSLDGLTSNCEVRRGSGSGTSSFKFKSSSSSPVNVNTRKKHPRIGTSNNATAIGTVTGSFSDTVATPCDGFYPADPFIAPTTGCGDTKEGLRLDLVPRGAFVYVTGPNVPLGPVSTSATGDCPSPVGTSLLLSSDLTACGDGQNLWQRSWGVAYSGRGLFASKLSISGKRLAKTRKGKTASITGRAVVDCNVPASFYSGGVTMRGELKYTLSFKRVR